MVKVVAAKEQTAFANQSVGLAKYGACWEAATCLDGPLAIDSHHYQPILDRLIDLKVLRVCKN